MGDTVKTNAALVEIFIEFKWDTNDDPFKGVSKVEHPTHDPLEHPIFFHKGSKVARDTLGQITSYAAAQLGVQLRTHIFSVFILLDTARLIRWDRSGAIVTEAIKYNESDLLMEFLFRYSKAPAAMRGKDTSVSIPINEELIAARDALQSKQQDSLIKLSIPDATGDRYFIAPTPKVTLYTPPGRATRGFKAYDILEKKVVFLKDSWRIDLPDILAEGITYGMLNAARAHHIPHCIASGDISTVKYHATKTHQYIHEKWAVCHPPHFIPHRHHRISLDVVGRVLTEFWSSSEMVSAVRDALIGEFAMWAH